MKKSIIEQAIDAIIRPPRMDYDPDDISMEMEGPNGEIIIRYPVMYLNERKERIIGSLYYKKGLNLMDGLPCMIYLHGNASSQLEGRFLVPTFCAHNVAVYLFDFCGCGKSDGEYISLGYYEEMDLNYLINQLNLSFNLGPFALWGRSMGAATAVMCLNDKVCCKVVDSAYTSISDVCTAIAVSMKFPASICPIALWFLKHYINGKANFDLSKVSALEIAKNDNQQPLLQLHAEGDEFVPFAEGEKIFKQYKNPEKEFVVSDGTHNSARDQSWIDKACFFILSHFGITANTEIVKHSQVAYDPSSHFGSYDDLIKFRQNHPNEEKEEDSPILLNSNNTEK